MFLTWISGGLAIITLSCAALASPYRVFTDRSGRTIEAQPIGLHDGELTLQRRDGKRFRWPKAKLSNEDQLFIDEWSKTARRPLFEFKETAWQETLTHHFRIRTKATRARPATPWAEKTWDVCQQFMPSLKEDFEQRGFRPPDEPINLNDFSEKDGRFRMDIYLLGLTKDFEHMAQQHLTAHRNKAHTETQLQLVREVGTFGDPSHRYRVHVKVGGSVDQRNVEGESVASVEIKRSGGKEKFVHVLANDLLNLQTRSPSPALWVRSGLGWWMEHHFFQRCSVQYIDLNKFYAVEMRKEGGSGIRRSEILSTAKSWVNPIKAMLKNGKRHSISDVLNANMDTLTPQLCGYVFAWNHFLLADKERKSKYSKLIETWRSGEVVTIDTLVKIYGYPDAESLEDAWHAHIRSDAFR